MTTHPTPRELRADAVLAGVLAALEAGPLSLHRLQAAAGGSRTELRRALDRLADAGRVELIGGAGPGFPARYQLRSSR